MWTNSKNSNNLYYSDGNNKFHWHPYNSRFGEADESIRSITKVNQYIDGVMAYEVSGCGYNVFIAQNRFIEFWDKNTPGGIRELIEAQLTEKSHNLNTQ